MTVHYEQNAVDLVEEGRANLVCVGLKFVGDASSAAPNRPRRQGGWPGRTPFQRGNVQIGLSPDWIDPDTVSGGTIDGLESLSEFEVVYDRKEIAKALLERNYLPQTVFGGEDTGFVKPVREALLDKLGLTDQSLPRLPEGEEEIKQALADIADVDYVDVATDESVATEYSRAATRAQALEAAAAAGMDVSETTLKSEAIEYLVGMVEADAREALRDAGAEV